MDNKIHQYQRAVTPTLDSNVVSTGASGLVRGKVLSYNSNLVRGRSTIQNGGSDKQSMNGVASMGSPSTRNAPTLSPRGGIAATAGITGPNSAGGVDMNIQGRSSGKSFGMGGGGNPSLASDQTIPLSVLPRYDLIPLLDAIPADGIIFARIRGQPVDSPALVVFRTPEERMRNPERLNLDRRQLEVCPLLEQEQRLRLLNFQNNNIRVIQYLENLPNLIFLDLYNNKITSLDGPALAAVKGLRVLMAGKNKITNISNLNPLRKLDVLDLHSNEIRLIEGLEQLSDLRVLNLAGNRISVVNNLSSLSSLTELNLRRNSIEYVTGLNQLPALQRVFLSHNSISCMEDIKCLFEVSYLIELSLDGNPLSEADPVRYRRQLVMGMPGLRHLDLKRVTDEERAGEEAATATAAAAATAAATVPAPNTAADGASGEDGGAPPVPAVDGAGGGMNKPSGSGPVAAADGGGTSSSSKGEALLPPYELTRMVQQRLLNDGSFRQYEQMLDPATSNGTTNCNEDSSRDGNPAVASGAMTNMGAAGVFVEGGAGTTGSSGGINGNGQQVVQQQMWNNGDGGNSSSSSNSVISKMERKGLQKYVNTPLSSDIAAVAAADGPQVKVSAPQGNGTGGGGNWNSGTGGGGGGGGGGGSVLPAAGGSPSGLAALARSGKLFNTHSVFDLEIIGPDEKALIAVGDNWEWAPSRRLLLNVTEASLYHMKRTTILSKFSATQINAMPALRCLRFVFDDFTSLKSVEFIPHMYGHLIEHLIIRNCPICNATSPHLLRSYFIASMPKLRSFNEVEISDQDRVTAESLYAPLIRVQHMAAENASAVKAASSAILSNAANSHASSSSAYSSSNNNSLFKAHQEQSTRQLMQNFYLDNKKGSSVNSSSSGGQMMGTSPAASASPGSATAEFLNSVASDFQSQQKQLHHSTAMKHSSSHHNGNGASSSHLSQQQQQQAGASVVENGLSPLILRRRQQQPEFDSAFASVLQQIIQDSLLEAKHNSR